MEELFFLVFMPTREDEAYIKTVPPTHGGNIPYLNITALYPGGQKPLSNN